MGNDTPTHKVVLSRKDADAIADQVAAAQGNHRSGLFASKEVVTIITSLTLVLLGIFGLLNFRISDALDRTQGIDTQLTGVIQQLGVLEGQTKNFNVAFNASMDNFSASLKSMDATVAALHTSLEDFKAWSKTTQVGMEQRQQKIDRLVSENVRTLDDFGARLDSVQLAIDKANGSLADVRTVKSKLAEVTKLLCSLVRDTQTRAKLTAIIRDLEG